MGGTGSGTSEIQGQGNWAQVEIQEGLRQAVQARKQPLPGQAERV